MNLTEVEWKKNLYRGYMLYKVKKIWGCVKLKDLSLY